MTCPLSPALWPHWLVRSSGLCLALRSAACGGLAVTDAMAGVPKAT